MSAFTLRVATPADADGITEAYLTSFATSYITQRCFPRSSPATHANWAAALASYFADPRTTILVVTDDSTSPPTVVGFAKWSAPVPDVDGKDGDAVAAPADDDADELSNGPWPPEGDVELARAFFGGITRKRHALMAGRRYWHLHILGVRPEYQGKGAARPLLRWGCERADVDRLPCYLDASPEAKPIYERYGFREVDTLVLGGGELVETMMVREAGETGTPR